MEHPAAQQERTVRTLDAYPAAAPEVGVWLGAMQTVRGGLLRSLGRMERTGFGQEFLDWRSLRSPDGEDSSATPEWVVYHLVEHEAGHMYEIHRMVRKWRARSAEA